MSPSWCLASSMSTMESATVWNARSHVAYQGYSHVSGIEMTSSLIMWNQFRFLTFDPPPSRSGWTLCSSSHLSRSKK